MLQFFRIKRIRCQGADSTNTTYQKIFLLICIQAPHFSRFMAAMTTLLVCVRRLSNELPAKFLEASEPFGAGRGRCDFHNQISDRTMPASPFCESRARHMMDLLHGVRYDGFSALPSTEHLVHQSSYVPKM